MAGTEDPKGTTGRRWVILGSEAPADASWRAGAPGTQSAIRRRPQYGGYGVADVL
jgi:hypothetical protein